MSIGFSEPKTLNRRVSVASNQSSTLERYADWSIQQVAELTAEEIVEMPAEEQNNAIHVVASRLPLDAAQIAGFDRATRRRYVFLARRCCQNLVGLPTK